MKLTTEQFSADYKLPLRAIWLHVFRRHYETSWKIKAIADRPGKVTVTWNCRPTQEDRAAVREAVKEFEELLPSGRLSSETAESQPIKEFEDILP
jgi:hypothetical protein